MMTFIILTLLAYSHAYSYENLNIGFQILKFWISTLYLLNGLGEACE